MGFTALELTMATGRFDLGMGDIPQRSFWRAVVKVLPGSIVAIALSLLMNVAAQALTSTDQARPALQTPLLTTLVPTQTLVVGSEQDYPPFATGMSDATAGGFTVDLWKAVATEAGLNYTLRVRPFHQLLEEFKEGKIDVLINLAISDARRQFADFTVPHVTVNGAIFVRKDQSTIFSEDDLEGSSIIVLNADLAHDYAVSKGWAKQLVVVDTAADGLRLLASGKHDAMLLSKLAGLQTLQALALPNVRALPVKAGFSQKFAFATQYGQADLLAKLNEGLAITKANGVYNGLYEKWFDVYEAREVGLRDILKYLIPVVILFLIWLAYLFYRRHVERTLASVAIAESRDLLMAVIDTAPVRVFWKGRNLRYLGCNTAFARDAGMTHPDELIGKDDYQMGWAAQAELYRSDDRAVMASGAAKLFYEEPQTTPSGQTIWLRTSKVPLKDHNNEVFGLLGVYEDITERKQAEDSIRAASQYARSLIEASLDPLVTINPQGKITDVNTATEKVTGLNRVSLIGSDFSEYLTDSEKAQEGFRQAFAQGIVTDYPLAIRHVSGKVTEVLYNASVYRDGKGNVLGVFAAARDVTERKKAENALKESEAFKNVILNSVDYEIAVLDHEGVILAVNEPWRRFARENRVNPDQPDRSVEVGANYLTVCEAMVGPESAEVHSTMEGIRAVLTGRSPDFSLEYPCHSPTQMRWFRMVVLPLGQSANAGVVITHTNITERVQSERVREATLDQLKKIASRVPGMVYQYRLHPDRSSCMPFASEAIREIYRVNPDEVREDASIVFNRIHPDDYESMVASIRKSEIDLTPWQHEYRVKFDDGTVQWLFGNAVPEREDDGSTLWYGFITDITARRQAQEQLRKLSIAVEQSPASVVITDLDANIEYVNPQFTKVSGYSATEVIGKNPRILQSKQTPEETYLKLWGKLTSGQPWHGELINKRKNGEVYWEESHIAPVRNTEGSVTHYVAIKTDITERKVVENLLAQSEANIKSVLEGAADALIVTDQTGRCQYVNEQVSRLLGFTRAELLQMTLADFTPSDDLAEMHRLLQQLVSTGSLRHEVRLKRKDDSTVPVDLNATLLPDGSVFGSFRDISERKKTEKLLRESQAHLQAIFENEPECIKIIDKQGLLVQMNPAGLAMIEADSLAQIKGAPVLGIVAPEYRKAYADLHKRVIAGEKMQMEFEMLGLKGGRLWMETHAVPMQENGQTVHLAVTRDITERKRIEDQVRQLAFHDSLTKLPNRRLLLDRLSQAIAASKRSGRYAAVLFLDLDNFKALNDAYGHGCGDLLLLEVADRLTHCVREIDTVARFGGDEFVVMISDLNTDHEESLSQARAIAEKIRVTLSEVYDLTIRHPGLPDVMVSHQCSASIGVALFRNHEGGEEDIIKWADAAMYAAKEGGRNAIRFHDEEGHT